MSQRRFDEEKNTEKINRGISPTDGVRADRFLVDSPERDNMEEALIDQTEDIVAEADSRCAVLLVILEELG